MPTPRKGYWVGKKRVPGVTTVIGRFKRAEGLMHWAWQKGCDGEDYREEKNQAATLGTIAHEIIDRYVHGADVPYSVEVEFGILPFEAELVATAVDAFLEWWWPYEQHCEVIATETRLICPKLMFGGTPDGVFRYRDKVCLFDWKTSKRLYDDYNVQLAAYNYLWNTYGVEKEEDKITGIIVDNMVNFETVKLFARENWEKLRLLKKFL